MPNFIKDSGDKLDYHFDWSEWLEENDSITASLWTVQTGLTVVDATVFDTRTTTLWIEGGVSGATYTAVNRITTSAGRVCERTMVFRIDER